MAPAVKLTSRQDLDEFVELLASWSCVFALSFRSFILIGCGV